MEDKSILKKIDEAIFKGIDNFISHPSLQESMDQFVSLDEEIQKVINRIFAVLIAILPLIIFGFVVFNNYQANSRVEDKRMILNSISDFIDKNGESQKLQNDVLSKSTFSSKADVEKKIINSFPSSDLPPKALDFINFRQHNPTSNLTQTNLDIVLNGLTPALLTSLIDRLINREKIKIAHVQVEKDPKSGLLKGKLHVIHFGKVVSK